LLFALKFVLFDIVFEGHVMGCWILDAGYWILDTGYWAT
jgi:hypothetical protein